MEPPPNVLKAGQLPARIRTGAKTATKDQERAFLDRFRQLADDPSPLVPRWVGPEPDPFARLRRKLARDQRKKDSSGWLKWFARGKDLHHAYAATLLVLHGAKIPSFASIKFRGRDLKFVVRGRGLRDKLIAVQNHEDPDARLLGYLDYARTHPIVLVSLESDFFATPPGTRLSLEVWTEIFSAEGVELEAQTEGVGCRHADGSRPALRYRLDELDQSLALCRKCIEKLRGIPQATLEASVLAPRGRFTVTKTVFGSELTVHPASARPAFDALVKDSGPEAIEKSKKFEGVTDLILLDWAGEALKRRLDERAEGALQVGDDLWFGEWAEAAQKLGQTDLERKLLALAWARRPPRLRTSDGTLNKLLEPVWGEQAEALLHQLSEEGLHAADAKELAAQRPSEALAALARHLRTEDRFAAYPKFNELPPALRFVLELFKAQRTGDSSLASRLGAGVRDPATKPVALALARAFGQSAGIEWQYAPHEKDQALFFEPAARAIARSDAETYVGALSQLATALGLEPPAPKGKPAT